MSLRSGPYKVLGRAHKSSTGTADVGALPPPAGARAFIISVSASTLLTLDGTTPAVNVGLLLPAGLVQDEIEVGSTLNVCGNAVASEIEVVWLG